MRRVGGLFERITAFSNLLVAARLAARGKQHRPAVARFLWDLEPRLLRLQDELRRGSWTPGTPKKFTLHDPKEREITVAPFPDRVVHQALCLHLGPVLERGASEASFACRVGKGTHRAILQACGLVRRHRCFLKGDVRRYFPSVDHAILKALLRRLLKDGRTLALLDRILDAGSGGIDAGGERAGLPIGNLTSQHLANFYLSGFDRFVQESLRPGGYLRYMDDFVLFDQDRVRLRAALGQVRSWLREERRLELKEPATLLTRSGAGLPFLGLRIFPGVVRLRRRKVRRFRLLLARRLLDPSSGRTAGARQDLTGTVSAAAESPEEIGQETRLQSSLGSILAPVVAGSSRAFRRGSLQAWVRGPAPTGSSAAAAGTTTRRTAVPRTGTGTRPATATTTSAFVSRARLFAGGPASRDAGRAHGPSRSPAGSDPSR